MKAAKLVHLPKIPDERGNLSFIERGKAVRLDFCRVYWTYDVPGGEVRGGHAFRKQQELIVALTGSFDVVLHDGRKERRYPLNRSYTGLYVPRMFWRRMENFSTNAVAMVLASTLYDADDYIFDFEEYLAASPTDEPAEAPQITSTNSAVETPQMQTTTVFNCNVLSLPKIHNRAGNITALNSNRDVPFEIRRVYYLYDVPGGVSRGGHAHRNLQQLIVAVSGSFDITVDDGRNTKTASLNRPDCGFLVLPGIWRSLTNFSSGAICLVLASLPYDDNDYIRNYQEFIRLKK
jgi:dTDP-4-dehydrorhamnose 3,5-epimerase-like enzyme